MIDPIMHHCYFSARYHGKDARMLFPQIKTYIFIGTDPWEECELDEVEFWYFQTIESFYEFGMVNEKSTNERVKKDLLLVRRENLNLFLGYEELSSRLDVIKERRVSLGNTEG